MKGDFRIGPWLIEPTLNRISQNGASRHLEPKIMQVLVCLARAENAVVSKQQLIDEVWKDTFVTDDVLTRAISELRDAFGDDARDPQIIQTIPKQGYRLMLPIASAGQQHQPGKRRNGRFLLLGAAVFALLVAGGWILAMRHRMPHGGNGAAFKVTRLTHSGKAEMAEVTPDGNSFYYVRKEGDRRSIWLRQMKTGSETVVLAPTERRLHALLIAPKNDYLYFTEMPPNIPTGIFSDAVTQDLYVMPALGGTPRKIAEKIHSAGTVSPDGSKIALLRARTTEGAWDVIVANADGTNEQMIHRRREPRYYNWDCKMSWSPDGRLLAVTGGEDTKHIRGELAIIDVGARTERVIPVQPWEGITCDTAWLPDQSGIVLQAVADEHLQLWFVNLISQTAHRITRDNADYFAASLTGRGQHIVTPQGQARTTIWIADWSNPMQARQITFSPHALDGDSGLSWTAGGEIVYGSVESGNQDIWLLNPESGSKQQLTADPAVDCCPRSSPDGRHIVFVKWDNNGRNIWRMDRDGRNPVRLTDTDGNYWPRISPDGKTVIFISSRAEKRRVWKVPTAGGKSEMVAGLDARLAFLSPDGKWIAICSTEHEPGRTVIINAETGAQVRTMEGAYSAFTPDSKGLLSYAKYKGVRNLTVRPLSGAKPYPLTKFHEKGIVDFDISQDGKTLAIVRGEQETDIVLITGFRNSP